MHENIQIQAGAELCQAQHMLCQVLLKIKFCPKILIKFKSYGISFIHEKYGVNAVFIWKMKFGMELID